MAHRQEAFQHADDETDEVPDGSAETDHYLVYLSGIGISSPHQLRWSIPMVQRLTERIGGTMVWRIYPYRWPTPR